MYTVMVYMFLVILPTDGGGWFQREVGPFDGLSNCEEAYRKTRAVIYSTPVRVTECFKLGEVRR